MKRFWGWAFGCWFIAACGSAKEPGSELGGSGGMAPGGEAGAAGAATAGSAGESGGGLPAVAGAGGMSDAGGERGVGGDVEGGGGAGTLEDVQAIFDRACVNCHDQSLQGLPRFPQLSLVRGDTYAALVNKPATEACGGTLVVPGNPASSYLVAKLREDAPCQGSHMPRAFELQVPISLPEDDIATIESWIRDGARPAAAGAAVARP